MRQTAQQRFNAFLEESHETGNAIRELETQARAHRNEYGYAYVAGVYAQMLQDVIMELPKARRQAIREELTRLAQKEANKALVDALSV